MRMCDQKKGMPYTRHLHCQYQLDLNNTNFINKF